MNGARLKLNLHALVAVICRFASINVLAGLPAWHVAATPHSQKHLDSIKIISLNTAANEKRQHQGRASAQAVTTLSRAAIQLWPSREAYQTLALAITNADQADVDDVELLHQGHTLFPHDIDITLGLAMGLAKSKRSELALLAVENLLHESIVTADRDRASLVHSWILQTEYPPRIKALVSTGHFDQAFALATQFQSRCIDSISSQAAEAMHTYVYIAQQIQAIDTVLQAESLNAIH